jgi:hypothetical protein
MLRSSTIALRMAQLLFSSWNLECIPLILFNKFIKFFAHTEQRAHY